MFGIKDIPPPPSTVASNALFTPHDIVGKYEEPVILPPLYRPNPDAELAPPPHPPGQRPHYRIQICDRRQTHIDNAIVNDDLQLQPRHL